MSERDFVEVQIPPAARSSSSEERPNTSERLCARLRMITARLRREYLLADNSASHSTVDEWLCDNYYVLERESKQSVRDIRQLARRAGSREKRTLMRVYAAFHKAISERLPPLDDTTVLEIAAEVNRQEPLSEQQFMLIPAAIKAVLLEIAYTAVTDSRNPEQIAYAVGGLGKLTAVDFDSVIQQCSDVEKILLEDPAGVYENMSDDSRSYYRLLTARIARKRRISEREVAAEALEAARQKNCHIGGELVGNPVLRDSARRRGRFTLLLCWAIPFFCGIGAGLWAGNLWLSLLLYLPLWEILRTPIQQIGLSGVDTDYIPRMDLDKLEEKPATVVLVSTLLPKAAEAPALASRLEQLYFSNTDPQLYYCVLADFKEWDYPTDEKDDSQIAAARKVVEQLNEKYGDRFLLFLRGRTYNPTQGRYSGWERKRGAITEFVRFLKGEETSLHTFVGSREILPDIKFIIALDSDTNLLYEAAQTLVSAAVHPLNRPVIGPDNTVVSGYGILTPKLSNDLASAGTTAFSRVMNGCGGVTAYETRDKDFYQDLFGEGIFAGKGLIDVDSFHTVLSDRFPDNRVLSHDILEGAYLRCGFVSDVEMTDSSPASMTSWLSRLHRWLRGDWQNILFLGRRYRAEERTWENPISSLSKYKLLDNLRRSLTPVAALLCILAAAFTPPSAAVLLAFAGVLAITFSSLWAAAWSLSSSGFFTLSRKFFTRTLPHTFELIGQGLFLLIMLPAQAFLTADAVLRSLWRTFVSHRKLLEWTTAAQSESGAKGGAALLRRFWLAELFGLALLFLPGYPALRLVGFVFALIIPVAYLSGRATTEAESALTPADRDALVSYNAAMWRYYEEFANRANHYLPPDNVQQSPVYRVATRTSPTNIGMMLLSTLAAADFDFIGPEALYDRVERTVSTVERLAKWHGNLFNWYDTATLDTLKPEFVSAVDSGNFICSLVALKEGLREFVPKLGAFSALVRRVEAIIDETDLTVFYDKKKHLFSIGYDREAETLSPSHYDFLMSEARLTSYYAVARKAVEKKHWGAMGRAMSRCGSYAGPVSWTGTMFEYFMPHLLLPVYEGSLLGESLSYCLYCQKRRAKAAGVPWGISESAFYAFDNNLNYQYKAHGVQKLGVKRYLDKDLVISPYSTFLAVPWAPQTSMRNLSRLRELGVYGRYGFFEAVDFTTDRVGNRSLAVTRSYMAHHIGMSMVASCNAVFAGRMQKRFMADNHMRSAKEFLQEKIAKSAVVYDSLNNSSPQEERKQPPRLVEEQRDINPAAPRCSLLTNGELTDVLTDTGAGYLKFGGADLTRRETDLLRRAQGVFTLARMNGSTLSSTAAPFYQAAEKAAYSIEQQEQCVTYYAGREDLEIGVRCIIHPTISCQQRQIVVKNKTRTKQIAEMLVYLEPVLAPYGDYSAHPAYSKLFVTASYELSSKTLTFSRRNRDSSSDLFLTVGFLEDLDFTFETQREALLSSPAGLEDLLHFPDKTFSGRSDQPGACAGSPDACCAIRFDLLVGPGGQQQATLLLSAAPSASEGIQNIIDMRKLGALDPKSGAKSPLMGDSLEARLGSMALGQLLFTTAACPENQIEKRENRLGQNALWSTGISGDYPIALLDCDRNPDNATLGGYLRFHTSLRSIGSAFDLVILCQTEDQREEIRTLSAKLGIPGSVLGARGGVFLLLREQIPEEIRVLLYAVARHIVGKGAPWKGEGGDAKPRPYRPALLRAVAPAPLPEGEDLAVEGGVFRGGRFYVDRHALAGGSSSVPWSHVLATPVFGTLVSSDSPGFTWAINSRENKLTPWYNDIATDNTGEMAVLWDGESYYNLTRGSRASFSAGDARYEGRAGVFGTKVTITISDTGCVKYIDVVLRNEGDRPRTVECAYYIEPVLAVNRDTARHIRAEEAGEGCLALHNPYNTAVQCWAALSGGGVAGAERRLMTDRAAFLSGDWQQAERSPTNDPCGVVILSMTLPPEQEVEARFCLSYGRTMESAVHMATAALPARTRDANAFVIDTPDLALNQFVNHFAAHQILASRIYGRTAFYQCGGAYGFRDQLQDVGAYLLVEPAVAKRQILRCCAVQFEEGDVLHWWHDLPKNAGGLRGVRTRFSDDLLWLPLIVADYVEKTGDQGILELSVRYLSAPELPGSVQEQYIAPERSALREDVYGHCLRALGRGYRLGENGLPLIGCGDWNDGFSAVGREGRGTSVWLALFLAVVLDRFARICALRGDSEQEGRCLGRAEALRRAVDDSCWDGDWYIRAFFDDGSKMGSRESEECRIDLLPQSFAVFAHMPDQSRVERGLRSAFDHLVDHKLRLVRLFDPPFQHSGQQPGYVKAYPSGIRENGGQYTHSAVWFAMALLEQGHLDDGFKILEMLNPVNRACQPGLVGRYKLEPYYMAADIYTNPAAPGRGGWSMYTGAVSWYYRAVLETLLGLTLSGDRVTFRPRLPSHWPGASLRAGIRGTGLEVEIRRCEEGEATRLECDGAAAEWVPLDGHTHRVIVVING